MHNLKKDILEIGQWIWQKDLTAGLSGNLSCRTPKNTVLITGRGTCLGHLREDEVGEMDLSGRTLDRDFSPSSEKPFHLSVYQHLGTQAVVHVHPAFSNGYFAVHDRLEPDTFETRLTLGDVPVVPQKTPAVTDIAPVVEALKKSNIVVLKHHGVVAVGENLKDAFFLVQTLEEAVKIACIKDLYAQKTGLAPGPAIATMPSGATRKYKLFSDEQIQEILRLVNEDPKFFELATETALETKLAVVLEENAIAYCFHFTGGRIAGFSHSADEAEFVITGKAEYWRQIFNRQLDPFAATTQKKLKLKGDFAKISRWYVPFNRLFELWQHVPVE